MKTVILASALAALCLASLARAQDVVVASGVPYRVSAVNSSLILVPEASFTTSKPGPVLSLVEQLSRCDGFVAQALEARGLAGAGDPRFVRDRVEPQPENRSWVLYAQRHQGHRILGAGGRLELDSYGRVVFAGLNYESEKLRSFRPMDSEALEKLAASAVPHPRMGAPISQESMIDPMGDAPAQLRAYVIYQVQANDRVEGWQVTLDAETGEVLDSFSLFMNAESPQGDRPRPEALDRPRPATGEVKPLPEPSAPVIIVDPLTVYVDIVGQCISLEIGYTAADGVDETRIVTYNDVLSVYPGTLMTVRDATRSWETCSRVFALNGAVVGLPHTFAVQDYDWMSLTSDCRPAVRSSEGTGTICFSRSLYINRIDPWMLTSNTTLSEGPIISVARYSSPNDFLAVPCGTVQIPPNSVTIQDNTRFDEVNAFYQTREFINNYLWGSLGISLYSGFRILTKEPESSFGVTGFNELTRILHLGAGDAYNNPGAGKHAYDASKFATVIHHEVSHALTGQLYGSLLPSHQARGINEGVADYMAASYNNNPALAVCYLSNYDHLRNADNLASDFRFSRYNTCQYPVSTGVLAGPGAYHTQGMIASGLLWDIRRSLGPFLADRILGDALRSLVTFPDFTQFGSAILAAAILWNRECEVRPLLVAREFPGITAGGAATPTGLNVVTSMPNRCKIYATWLGTAQTYKVTWTPDGGTEQTLAASQTLRVFDGSVGTKNGGTVKVYSIYCGVTNNTPASARREAVTATSQSPAIRAINRLNAAGGTETLVEWDDVPGTPNWRLLRNGVAWGPDLPGSQRSKVDPAGCGGTFNYCVQIVDCGGSHGVGPCQSATRPGTPLSVTMSGPTALPYGTLGTFTANITGGCGVARIDWYWMTECSSGGGGGPPQIPVVYPEIEGTPDPRRPTIDRGSREGRHNEILIEQCDTWYRYSLPSLANPIQKGFSHGSYAQLKVIVTDVTGPTATAIKRIRLGSSITYEPGETSARVDEDRELPMQLEWNGSSIALVNVKSGSAGIARLQVFDVAGRRRVEVEAPLAGSSRIEFPVAKDLARGVYFAKVEIPGHEVISRTIRK